MTPMLVLALTANGTFVNLQKLLNYGSTTLKAAPVEESIVGCYFASHAGERHHYLPGSFDLVWSCLWSEE